MTPEWTGMGRKGVDIKEEDQVLTCLVTITCVTLCNLHAEITPSRLIMKLKQAK
jgi:hypothetical protein